MKSLQQTILYSFVVGVVFFPTLSFASSFFFETDYPVYGQNDTVTVDVFLDSQDKMVNTISGQISLSESIDTAHIIDGNSSVLFWVDRPSFEQETHIVSFAGIIPGGLSDDRIFLFSIMVKQKDLQSFELSMSDFSVLLHDGNGTRDSVFVTPKTIFISDEQDFSVNEPVSVDREKPEDFTPTIAQDEFLFDGKLVLVFATQDKDSGIAYYKVKEGLLGRYTIAVSPFVLSKQNLFTTIFVKAVDNEGNERLAILHPQKTIFNKTFFLIFGILIIVIIYFVYLRKKKV